MAFTGRFPVKIVATNGFPVKQVSGLDGAYPMTPVTVDGIGWPVILSDFGYPVVLVNEDGTEYTGTTSEGLKADGSSKALKADGTSNALKAS